jgi:hypothetical protein
MYQLLITSLAWGMEEVAPTIATSVASFNTLEEADTAAEYIKNTNSVLQGREMYATKLYAPKKAAKKGATWSDFGEAYKKACDSGQPNDWMKAACIAQQIRNSQEGK